MQNINKVQQGQTFIDMVCQQSGSYEAVVKAAILNGKSITGDVAINEQIDVNMLVDENIVAALARNPPATAIKSLLSDDPEIELEGISYWAIADDFQIS